MFRKTDPELERLQRELMAVEEDWPEEFSVDEPELYTDADIQEDISARFNVNARYDRRKPKKFDDDDFFEDGFDQDEVLLKKDYKRKNGRSWLKTLALTIVAAAELAAIIGILLWVASWAL